jgi:predicted SnoaL-like aldol condensation-catalyzing enzyme
MSDHKEAATTFLRLAASGDVRRAFDSYAAPDFRHDNPHFASDAESLAHAMAENTAQNPYKKLEILRVIEDDDVVVLHSRVRLTETGPDIALIHIFRFENDRVVELWDIGQPVPDNSPNQLGMF